MIFHSTRFYFLHWKKNRATQNTDLKTLIAEGTVKKINGKYYTTVYPHLTGDSKVMVTVDCTCDSQGNNYPVPTSDLVNPDMI
jgi:hypothetical protein